MYPQDWLQLLIVIGAVVPGFVYQTSRRRVRGPDPEEQTVAIRVLRSIAASFIFIAGYAIAFGYPLAGLSLTNQGIPEDSRAAALWVLALVFVVPWIAARIVFYLETWELVEKGISKISNKLKLRRGWDPTPSAWDFAFSARGAGWVRVQTNEGVWMGGWYGSSSFASSFPDARELYLEVGYAMNDDGTFGDEISAPGGIYIRCDDVRLVDFTPVGDEPTEDRTIGNGSRPNPGISGTEEA